MVTYCTIVGERDDLRGLAVTVSFQSTELKLVLLSTGVGKGRARELQAAWALLEATVKPVLQEHVPDEIG